MNPPPRVIDVPNGHVIEKEALWMMLAGDAVSVKDKETNIKSSLRQLCIAHRLTFNKDKNVTLNAIQKHQEASRTLLNGYRQWQALNEHALSHPEQDLPDTVAIPVGFAEHRCQR